MVFVVREKEYEQAMNFMVESKFKFIDFFLRSLKIAFFFFLKNFLFVVHNSFAIKFSNVNHTKLVWSLDLCTI